jgi:Dolichyl-phosphate-mannose-protein mannosyltransferase
MLQRRLFTTLSFSLMAGFLVYIALRAVWIPITTDEANTCITHIHRTWWDILTYETDAYPNNHPLNTLGIKLFSGLFGLQLWTARLPNFLGAVVYVWASWGIVKRLTASEGLRVALLVVLLGNPLLAEFFGLARGYGLGAGLMMGAIFVGWRYLEERNYRDIWLGMGLAALSVLSNFTLLYFFLPYVTLFLLIFWEKRQTHGAFLKNALPVVAGALFAGGLIAQPLAKMNAGDELRYWGMGGFWKETLMPLLSNTLRTHTDGDKAWMVLTVAVLVVLVTLTGWYLVLRRWRRGRLAFDHPQLWAIGLFIGAFTVNVALTFCFATPFLNARTALFYGPLFSVQLVMLMSWLSAKKRWVAGALIGLCTLLFALNFWHCANVKDTYEWWFDAHSLRVLRHIRSVAKTENRDTPFTLDMHSSLHNSYHFHVRHDQRGYARWVNITDWHPTQPPAGNTDFYVTENQGEVDALRDTYQVALEIDPSAGWYLLRKK